MKKIIAEWMVIISKIASWILSVLVIYWIILKLTNHSPSSDQVMLTVMAIIAGGVFTSIGLIIKLVSDVRDIKSDLRNHAKECDRRFYALALDFKNTDNEFRKHMIRCHEAKYP